MDCLHNFISCVELICWKPLGLFSSGFILDRYGLCPSEKSAQRVKIKLNTWKQSQNWLESLLNVKCIAGSYLSFYDMIERKKNQCQTQLISAEFLEELPKLPWPCPKLNLWQTAWLCPMELFLYDVNFLMQCVGNCWQELCFWRTGQHIFSFFFSLVNCSILLRNYWFLMLFQP